MTLYHQACGECGGLFDTQPDPVKHPLRWKCNQCGTMAEFRMEDNPVTNWSKALTKREYSELMFAQDYAINYRHGTDGHTRLLLLARLFYLLEKASQWDGK